MTPDEALALIAANGERLTRRQRSVLSMMAKAHRAGDFDAAELVYERGAGFVDLEQVSGRTLMALLRACAITESQTSDGAGHFEVYNINETGLALVDSWGGE